ncbi:LptF/LptG family permease [Thermocrinis sp.]
MLFLYNLREFLKTFFLLSLVFVSLLSFYSVLELFLFYKRAEVQLLPKLILTTLLISFYYIAPLINSLSLMLFLRRVFSRSYDRIASSFGVSALSFLSPILIFSLFLSLTQLALSYSLYPNTFKTAHTIEREFKKGKPPEELLLSNLWLSLNTQGENLYVRIGFADLRVNKIYDVFLVSLSESYINKLITAEEGYWEGETLKLKNAEINLFDKELQERRDITIGFIPVEKARAFGQKLEHLSMDRLFSLYLLAGKIGMNKELYLAEFLRRLIVSFSNVVVVIPLALSLMRERRFLKPSVFLLIYMLIYVFSLNLVKVVAEEFGESPLVGSIPFLVLSLISARSLYYLRKG